MEQELVKFNDKDTGNTLVSFDKGEVVEVKGMEFRIVYTKANQGRMTLEALPVTKEVMDRLREKCIADADEVHIENPPFVEPDHPLPFMAGGE